jgi:hypothetical protein
MTDEPEDCTRWGVGRPRAVPSPTPEELRGAILRGQALGLRNADAIEQLRRQIERLQERLDGVR